jgi:2-dehydro-3-deoxyphosphogluconate aldolase/(4S)-4-hydroxy-2-oxoglutarate aldolase
MTKLEVCAMISDVALIPALRVSTPDEALFAADAVSRGGIPIVELTMTVPGAPELIAHLVKQHPQMVIGAGTVLDVETARRCVDAGAMFITSPGLNLPTVEFAVKAGVAVLPGVLTPTEIMAALKAGADFVKVFPCEQLGGPSYIRALKAPFPEVPFIASGGVNQQNAGDYIRAGVTALGIGVHLIPPRAIAAHESAWIVELARRFAHIIGHVRAELSPTD